MIPAVKVVILAGGPGTRLAEETETKPKPMVEIGGRPILWHIMKHYAAYGHDDFIICVGYKGSYIKRYFAEALAYSGDLTIDFTSGVVHSGGNGREQWKVTMVDTGAGSETGGRLLKIREHVAGERFLMTYGDGVSDVDLDDLVRHHGHHGRLATVTAVHPIGRFGHMELDGDKVTSFDEKPQMRQGWINGGYFVLEPGIFDYIPGDVDWAKGPLGKLAADDELVAYRHEGFWQCMDTLRDRQYLEQLWSSGAPPWKTWTGSWDG